MPYWDLEPAPDTIFLNPDPNQLQQKLLARKHVPRSKKMIFGDADMEILGPSRNKRGLKGEIEKLKRNFDRQISST